MKLANEICPYLCKSFTLDQSHQGELSHKLIRLFQYVRYSKTTNGYTLAILGER